MGFVTHPGKSMPFHNALEPFSFRGAYGIKVIAFLKYILRIDGIPKSYLPFKFHSKIPKLNNLAFWSGAGLFKMAHQCFGGVLFLTFTITQLNRIVPVCTPVFYLCHYIRTSFY